MNGPVTENDLLALLKRIIRATSTHPSRKILEKYQIAACLQAQHLRVRRLAALVNFLYLAKENSDKEPPRITCINLFLDSARSSELKLIFEAMDFPDKALISVAIESSEPFVQTEKDMLSAAEDFNFRLVPDPAKNFLFIHLKRQSKTKTAGGLFFRTRKGQAGGVGRPRSPASPMRAQSATKKRRPLQSVEMGSHMLPIFIHKNTTTNNYEFLKCVTSNLMLPLSGQPHQGVLNSSKVISLKVKRSLTQSEKHSRRYDHSQEMKRGNSKYSLLDSPKSVDEEQNDNPDNRRRQFNFMDDEGKYEQFGSDGDIDLAGKNMKENSVSMQGNHGRLRDREGPTPTSVNKTSYSLKSKFNNLNAMVKIDKLNRQMTLNKKSNPVNEVGDNEIIEEAAAKDLKVSNNKSPKLKRVDFKINLIRYLEMCRRKEEEGKLTDSKKPTAFEYYLPVKNCFRKMIETNRLITLKYGANSTQQDISHTLSVEKGLKLKPSLPKAKKDESRVTPPEDYDPKNKVLRLPSMALGSEATPSHQKLPSVNIQRNKDNGHSNHPGSFQYLVHKPTDDVSKKKDSKPGHSSRLIHNDSLDVSSINMERREVDSVQPSENLLEEVFSPQLPSRERFTFGKEQVIVPQDATSKRKQFQNLKNSSYFMSYKNPKEMENIVREFAKSNNHLKVI